MSEDKNEDQQNQQEEELAGCFGFGCLVFIIMFIIMFVCVLFGLHL